MRLTEKYRPVTFDEVLGQEKTVETLKSILSKDGKLPPAILFSGPSGVGKTTLARVLANEIHCMKENIMELNASEKNSIEDMREVIELSGFITLGANKARIIILDEAHMLSKSAWNALLKPVEEPAAGVTWIFCSTEPHKIPESIKTRCTPFELIGVSPSKIKHLLDQIIEKEEFACNKQISSLISMKCEKSPRRALKYLEMLHGETSLLKAQELLKSSIDGEELPTVLALGRILKEGGKNAFLNALEVIRGSEEDPIGVKYGLIQYFSTVCIRSKNIEDCKYALSILHTLSKPYDPAEKWAPLLLALGSVLIE